MISSFRRFFQSKIGMAFFIAFLVLVALSFAAADLTGSTFGGVSGGDRAAVVGDEEISTSELASTAASSLQRVRQDNPTVTMPAFIAQGGLDEVLNQMIDRAAIAGFAKSNGLRAGQNLVNSEILQIGAFQGVSGEFDQEVFQNALRQQRLSENLLRKDLAEGLLAQQTVLPAIGSLQMPDKVARRYAELFLERRNGNIAVIPSALFLSDEEPDAAAIETYYSDNRSNYLQPERRTLRYAVFGAENIDASVTPTEEEIAARFEQSEEQYAARETRDVTSFFVPTQEGAQAIVAQIRAGKSLETAAREAGFNTTSVEDRDQEQFAQSTSFAVAESVFSTPRGAIAEPARSTLGWYIARVDDVTNIPARTLPQVRGEIVQQLETEKRAAALADLSARIEEQVDERIALTEIAEEFDLTLETTPALLADGRIFDQPQIPPIPQLRPILDTAFGIDESQPQLDVLVPGSQFLVYEVTEIRESATAPLAEIRERVVNDYKLSEASKEAQAVAKRVLENARGEMSLAEALRAEETDLPPADTVSLEQRELLQLRQSGRPVPPALVLMFSMAEGTIKQLEAPRNQGWILVNLDNIQPGEIEEGSPILAQARQNLSPSFVEEMQDQMVYAMRESVGVERNENAIEAVRRQLAGENQ